jgi:DnaK suppressor protein
MSTLDYQEFELRLQKMKEELESNIARLSRELESIVLEDDVDDLSAISVQRSESMNHTALLKQQRHELEEVDHAIAKLGNNTYGICEESGDTIPVERLRAEPHTRYCLNDADEVEKRR